MKLFLLLAIVTLASGCKKCITLTDANGVDLCEKCFLTTQQQNQWLENHPYPQKSCE